MAKKRGLALILLSAVMGIFAAWFANDLLQKKFATSENTANEQSVVQASLAIPFGTKVEPRHVRVVTMPKEAVPPNSFASIEEVRGKVATSAILEGETLLEGRFAEQGSGSTLAAVVEKSMRAITVRVDDVVGVAGFLLPGNRVDVLATRKEKRRAVTETILRNIKVLAVDQTASPDGNEPVVVRAVTLEMTPKQTETLVKGKEEGRIQLTLRNPLDDVVPEEEAPVVEPPRQVAVAAPPPRPVVRTQTLTVIRGTQVQQQKSRY